MQLSKEVTSHVQKQANTDEGWKIFKMKIIIIIIIYIYIYKILVYITMLY